MRAATLNTIAPIVRKSRVDLRERVGAEKIPPKPTRMNPIPDSKGSCVIPRFMMRKPIRSDTSPAKNP
jgi:hypothetical protein